MAYFGRKPKKPGSVPGAGSGFVQQGHRERVERAVERLVAGDRPGRPGRASRALRGARGARAGRAAR